MDTIKDLALIATFIGVLITFAMLIACGEQQSSQPARMSTAPK